MKEKKYHIKNDCGHTCSFSCYNKQSDMILKESSLPQATFYFMRHGETEWNQIGLIQGCIDISLSDKGIEQAHQAAEGLKGISIGTVISSPLQRAKKTAEIIAESLGKSVTVIDEFRNACYGSIEGKSKTKHHAAYSRWKTGYMIEGAECYPCFTLRVYEGLTKALQYPGPVLIVAHGGVHWPLQDILSLDSFTPSHAIPIIHLPPTRNHHVWVIKYMGKSNHE